MLSTLKHFGFGNKICIWIKTLYKNGRFSVKNKGYSDRIAKINRGVRQGCPLAALMLILVVEILAIHIKENKDIKGFTLGNDNVELQLSQYTDDTTTPAKNTRVDNSRI